jgi:lipopolysaccharide export system protein LptA
MKWLWGVLGAMLIAAQAGAAEAPKPPAGLRYESGKPIQVNADTFLADLNAETGTYRGNVVVVQGDIKLHADEVRVIAPDGKARRMEAHGHVVVDSPSGSAIGDAGVYDVVARVIHLTGHVVLTKNQNVMRGSALDVQMATGEARLTAVSATGQPARVQAVIVPQHGSPDKPAQAPAHPPSQTPAPPPAAPSSPPNP